MGRNKPPRIALFRLGFRPFYLLAAALALIAVPYWVAIVAGQTTLVPVLSPMLWHAHEMLFGFAIAVIVGFLLTATKAWTGIATPQNGHLATLAAIWLAGRIAAFATSYTVYAAIDSIFLPLVAIAIFDVLQRAKNIRNMPLVGILVALSLLNIIFHLSVLKVITDRRFNRMRPSIAPRKRHQAG